jgi:hypothetical protein
VEQCPVLWADSLSGQGTVRMKMRTTSLGNGTLYLQVTEKANGTATDSNGATFPFSNSNSFKFQARSSRQGRVTPSRIARALHVPETNSHDGAAPGLEEAEHCVAAAGVV